MINLVTGGSGFIGNSLVRALRQRGEAVRVLDARRPAVAVRGVDYRSGSINDPVILGRAMRGCARVYHLAALAALWTPDRRDFFRVNLDGTRAVLKAAREAGVDTVVHVSSEATLIEARRRASVQLIHEQTEIAREHLAGPYCESKWRADRAARQAWEQRGQRVIVCTPTVPVGPGDPWLTPPSRMLLGYLNQTLPAWTKTTLNLVDVRDVAEGLVRAAEHGRPEQRCLLSGHNVPMAALLALLERLSGVTMPRMIVPWPLARVVASVSEWLADHVHGQEPQANITGVRLAGARARFSNFRTRNELDWWPRPLHTSLADALADFQARGLWQPATTALPAQQPNRAR